jgi:hypothetical protein
MCFLSLKRGFNNSTASSNQDSRVLCLFISSQFEEERYEYASSKAQRMSQGNCDF